MQELIIKGGNKLNGNIMVAGSKNAALPIMTACILSQSPVKLSRLAHLSDIFFMGNLLENLGGTVSFTKPDEANFMAGMTCDIHFTEAHNAIADYDLVRKMRAGVLVLGPLLARYGRAEVSLPGGCAIGTRPVDLHIEALQALGASITTEAGYIKATAPNGLQGNIYRFPKASVGATENALMAMTLARGQSQLQNAATEPEITDLAKALCSMGAKIDGIGTDTLTVQGVESLNGTAYKIAPDRIEAGTLAIAAAACGSDVTLTDIHTDELNALWQALKNCGISIETTPTSARIQSGGKLQATDITTAPYPGFPTDLQAQMAAALCLAEGTSHIYETIFENRFMHVSELSRLGADISAKGNTCTINGVKSLTGAPVMATDLRASASLIIAALQAKGTTNISRIYHLDRGYEFPERKFAQLGASIERKDLQKE